MARVLAIATSAAFATGAAAQTPNIRVAGRVQTQFATASGDSTGSFNPSAVVSSSYEIRRLRIQADVRLGDNINMVLQPSFEMGALRMRDAYLRVVLWHNPTSGFGLTMGQEKKPFNRYELTSSNNLLSIERGARFRGFSGVAAQNNLLEENGYLAHDLGASADFTTWQNRFTVKAGLYNGSGESSNDVNNAKTFGARATATVIADEEARPVLRLGAAVVSRDRSVTTTATSTTFSPDSSRRTSAIGLDAEWGDFRPGLHVIADFASGKTLRSGTDCLNGTTAISCRVDVGRNTANLRPNTPDSALATFRSFQVVGGWRWQPDDPNGTRLVKIIEPALRLDYTDPNTSRDDDHGMLITPVLNVYFAQTMVLRAGLDLYRYKDAAGASRSFHAFRLSWQANF
ncbi:MAG: porin [Gemmatimonadales bacterium]|nr:porin [Gemmatimonadales bacterium]